MQDKELIVLMRILDGEQQIIQRTDQKAFTMLSLLGVFLSIFWEDIECFSYLLIFGALPVRGCQC